MPVVLLQGGSLFFYIGVVYYFTLGWSIFLCQGSFVLYRCLFFYIGVVSFCT